MLTQRMIYEFDDFRVDTGHFLLTKNGHGTPITPTVFRILLILLERAGQIVAKEELISFVWPDSFVEEGNLNRNVSTLRKALGEKPSDHKFIETIPKSGYRFVAPVHRIEYRAPTDNGRPAPNGPEHYIAGRDRERQELRRAFELAQQGHGGLVCLSGDVGLGKTALLDAFIGDLGREGIALHVARGRCSEPLTEIEPFMPWIEALGGLTREESVKGIMEKAAPTWHKEITHAGAGHARRMKRELLDFCREVSPIYPLLIIIDDFHWADVDSVDLVAFLASRLESTRTLVVLSYRMTEMKLTRHPFLEVRSDLLSRRVCSEIRLGFLQPADISAYLAREYSDRRLPADYAEFLQARTEGNPLFMRELARANGKGELAESIRIMIQRKIDRVTESDRQLLVTASVQGREFDSAVLAKSLGMTSEEVEEKLRVLDEAHGLIHRIREEELPDGKFSVRYRFVYAFYQEVCYASLAPSRKASLNASLAEAFLTYYGG